MGYCYGRGPSGRWVLSCDQCGRSDGTARKVRCAFGYCPAVALCSSCRSAPVPPDFFTRNPEVAPLAGVRWSSKALHRAMGCERRHLEYMGRQDRERELVAGGAYLRRSAMSTDARDPATGETIVQVVFSRALPFQPGPERWALMLQSTYRAVTISEAAQAADFLKVGAVVAGPVGFEGHGSTTTADVVRAWSEARPLESGESYGGGPYKAAGILTVGGSA